ncbi:hypothetical protein HID58_084948 [Brassica napus]|uniref:Uncharacterized protein n=1 Tax=Brassica napus TaxID=3708 RepID=A0ABQ7XL86_BRANA|nr:hypothetical protein HID58_084948 [Brassica napus]
MIVVNGLGSVVTLWARNQINWLSQKKKVTTSSSSLVPTENYRVLRALELRIRQAFIGVGGTPSINKVRLHPMNIIFTIRLLLFHRGVAPSPVLGSKKCENASSDNGTSSPASGHISSTPVEIPKPASVSIEGVPAKSPTESSSTSDNGRHETDFPTTAMEIIWVNGTWNLKQFEKEGKTDWDLNDVGIKPDNVGQGHLYY